MFIKKNKKEEASVLTLSGRLDTNAAHELQEALLAEINESLQVILDFSELSYLSSAGLRVLLMGEKATKAHGGKLTVIRVSDEIMGIIKMTGFTDVLDIG